MAGILTDVSDNAEDWARLGDGRKANLGRLYQWSGYFQWTRSFAILADQAPRRSNGITMRNTKLPFISTILLMAAFSGPSFGQERVFNWLPANDESVRLDPANYHTARTYRPNAPGASWFLSSKGCGRGRRKRGWLGPAATSPDGRFNSSARP